jgi:single-strand DNA-binding protein
MNTINLIGNLTRDTEKAFTGDNGSLFKYSLAVNERVKKDGEWVDKPCYIELEYWSKSDFWLLTKGSKVAVVGRLNQDTWEDKETGAKRSKHTVKVNSIQLLGGKAESNNTATDTNGDFAADDDLPF